MTRPAAFSNPVSAPVPGGAGGGPSPAPMVVPTAAPIFILPLPAILRGKDEVMAHLRLPVDFVTLWTETETEKIPGMPHWHVGGTKVFNTAAVVKWLADYHGYGGDQRSVAKCPAVTRKRKIS